MRDWQFVVRSEEGQTSQIAVFYSPNQTKLLYALLNLLRCVPSVCPREIATHCAKSNELISRNSANRISMLLRYEA